MPIDAMLGRRKPFTASKALVYILALVGFAATIALPVVLILANNSIKNQKVQLSAQDEEIERLKSENRKAIPPLAVLPSRGQETGAQQRVDGAKPGSGGVQVLSKQNAEEVAMTSLQPHAHDFHVAQREADTPIGDGPNGFENKLALLHRRVVGAGTRPGPANSDDFESRLARLHAKVVRKENAKHDVAAK